MSPSSTLDLLRRYESRNVTFMESDGSWPIVWDRARGVYVWDETGRRYLDLTAAFGVAAAGHANPRVVTAGSRQMGRLLHAMGDVHPHRLKANLAKALSELTFEKWVPRARSSPSFTGKTIFCNSGFEAVEAALKTARLATGRPGVVAFEQAYHGLGYGALNITYRAHFRSPFRNQLREFGTFISFPSRTTTSARNTEVQLLERTEKRLRHQLSKRGIGAILVEPIQARGGINIPPIGFLPLLRELCDKYKALLILDEIYTGFGRTGAWFACEHSGVLPDIVCLGKALTGGFPLSACIGKATVMDAAWPASSGEAIHTSTFLGHPVGCAMALANIHEIQQKRLVAKSAKNGALFLYNLTQLAARASSPRLKLTARGLGLLAGLELQQRDGRPATEKTLRLIKTLLGRGIILLPEGEHANVISFSPPLTITRDQLERVLHELEGALMKLR